jgi:serine/threonine-protein kinase RsbT
VKIVFDDNGPGIADVELALKDGYTTGKGLGLGLGGARRLCNEFTIESVLGKGTSVAIARWK